MTSKKRPDHKSRLGREGGIGYAIGIASAIAFGTIGFVGASNRGGGVSAGVANALLGLQITSVLAGVLIAALLMVAWTASRRVARLRLTNPEAVVLPSGRLAVLSQWAAAALPTLSLPRTQIQGLEEIPLYFAIVIGPAGIELWHDTKQEHGFARFGWDQIAGIEPSDFAERGRRTNGIAVKLTDAIYAGEPLPLAVLGRGVAGLFPQKRDELVDIVDSLGKYMSSKSR